MTNPVRPAHLALYLPGAALTILAMLLLGFLAHLTLFSYLRYERAQVTAYADFRVALAKAQAHVGQTDEQGRVVPPGTAVAVLRIPVLGVSTVVFEGTSPGVLQEGPGHRRDTVLPGQEGTSVIMGRRAAYGAPFVDLNLLVPNDRVFVVTGQGEHEYDVIALRTPGERAPAPSETAPGRLVLVTADGPAYLPRDLLYVYAELLSPVQPAAKRRFGAASLPAAERPMATDESAWIPLVLWGQVMLLVALVLAWARARFGRWPAWVVGTPVFGAVGLTVADQASRLLPNLM